MNAPPSDASSAWTIALRPRPRLPIAVMAFLVSATAGFIAVVWGRPVRLLPLGVGFMLFGGLTILALRRRRGLAGSPPPPVVVTKDALFLPRGGSARTVRAIPLADVTSIEERGTRAARQLVVGTRQGFVTVPAALFAQPDGPAQLRRAVHDAMRTRPDGPALLAEMSRRDAHGRQLASRKTWATIGLSVAVVAVFLIELVTGARENDATLLRLGANAPVLVRDGQWWRLFTANLLHLGWVHIYFNLGALVGFGTMLERLLGTPCFVVAVLLSGLAGNVLSASVGRYTFSAGASAMAFGLMGALLVVNVLHRSSLPGSMLLGRRRWVALIGLNGAISLLPMVDGLAHLGGMIAGAATTLALAPRLEMPSKVRAVSIVLAGVLVTAYVAGIGAAAWHFASAAVPPANELAIALFDADLAPERQNALAWTIAVDPSSQRELLVPAEQASRRAVIADPENGSYMDTQAYLLHRLGDDEAALALERRAAWHTALPAIFTMLHRLLSVRPAGPESRTATVTRARDTLIARTPGRSGAVIYAGVHDRGGACGLLRMVLPAGADEGRGAAPAALAADASVTILLVDASSGRPEQPAGETQIAFHPCDAATTKLP